MSLPNMEHCDYLFKIVLIGDSGVGKTNILSRFIMDVFQVDSKTTIGVEFSSKCVKRGDKIIKAQVWDTAGQERYRAITTAYYRGAVGAFVVFDVSKRESFDHLQTWIEELAHQTNAKIPILIVGNKSDLVQERLVTTEEASAFAEQHEMAYIETSALNCTNINEAFDIIIDNVYKSMIKDIDEETVSMNQSVVSGLPQEKESIKIQEETESCRKPNCKC